MTQPYDDLDLFDHLISNLSFVRANNSHVLRRSQSAMSLGSFYSDDEDYSVSTSSNWNHYGLHPTDIDYESESCYETDFDVPLTNSTDDEVYTLSPSSSVSPIGLHPTDINFNYVESEISTALNIIQHFSDPNSFQPLASFNQRSYNVSSDYLPDFSLVRTNNSLASIYADESQGNLFQVEQVSPQPVGYLRLRGMCNDLNLFNDYDHDSDEFVHFKINYQDKTIDLPDDDPIHLVDEHHYYSDIKTLRQYWNQALHLVDMHSRGIMNLHEIIPIYDKTGIHACVLAFMLIHPVSANTMKEDESYSSIIAGTLLFLLTLLARYGYLLRRNFFHDNYTSDDFANRHVANTSNTSSIDLSETIIAHGGSGHKPYFINKAYKGLKDEILAEKKRQKDVSNKLKKAQINKIKSIYEAQSLFNVGLDDKTLGVLKELQETVKKPVNVVHDFNHEKVLGVVKNAFGEHSDLLIDLAILYMLYTLIMRERIEVKERTLITVLTAVLLWRSPYLHSLISVMSKKDNRDDVIQMQGSGFGMVKAFTIYVYTTIFNTDQDITLEFFLNKISKMEKYNKGIEFTFNFFTDLLRELNTFLGEKLGKSIPSKYLSINPEADIFVDRVNEFHALFLNGAPFDIYNFEEYKRIVSEFNRLKVKFSSKDDLHILNILKSVFATCDDIGKKYKSLNMSGCGPRVKPYAIMIGGIPDVGKTTATNALAQTVTGRILPENRIDEYRKNRDTHLYSYAGNSDFMDGYHNQTTVFVDELGQKVDVAGDRTNDYLDMIRMINNQAYITPQAELGNKGCIMFDSKLMFATTNNQRFQINSITTKEAFIRRFDGIWATPKREYAKNPEDPKMKWKTDFSKLNGEINLDIYDFHKFNFRDGVLGDNPMNFYELEDYIVKNVENTMIEGAKILDKYQKEMERAINQRISAQSMFGFDGINLKKDFIWSKYEELKQRFGEYAMPTLDCFKSTSVSYLTDNIKTIGLVISGAAIGGFLIKYVTDSFLDDNIKQSPNMEVIPKSESDPIFKKRGKKPLRKKFNVNTHAESCYNPGSLNFLRKVFRNNMYEITCDGVTAGTILFVKGRNALMPRHFCKSLGSDNSMVTFTCYGNRTQTFHYPSCELIYHGLEDDTQDICLVELPKRFPARSDLTNYFINEDMIDPDVYVLIGCPRNGILTTLTSRFSIVKEIEYGDDESIYSNHVNIAYQHAFQKGDCGSLITVADKRSSVPVILGYHVAGTNNSGFGYFVSKDTLDFLLKLTSKESLISFKHEDLSTESEILPQSSDGSNVICKGDLVRINRKSKVKKSDLYGKWSEPTCGIASLTVAETEDGIIDVMIKARSKYSRDDPIIDYDMLSACRDSFMTQFYCGDTENEPWEPRVYTYEEAVKGVDGVDYCDAMNRKSGCGYGYQNLSKPGKAHFFGSSGPFDTKSTNSRELKVTVEKQIARMIDGERQRYILIDRLKDERRPLAKIAEGKTRLYCESPIDKYIIDSMYFKDFIRYAMNNQLYNGLAIGVNPYTQWTIFAKLLRQHGTGLNCDDGDFGSFDASEFITLIYVAGDIIERYYYNSTPEDRMVRAVLIEEMANSLHVYNGTVYEWMGSNPSGNLLTTIINCISAHLLIRYNGTMEYLKQTFESDQDTFIGVDKVYYINFISGWNDNVYLCVFGDDNIYNVSDEYAPYLGAVNLSKHFARIGMKYTNADKNATLSNLKKLEDCSFLKRSFHKQSNGSWLAPLEIGVILESPYWTKTSTTDADRYRSFCNMYMELCLHKDSVYNEHKAKFIQNCFPCFQKPLEVEGKEANIALSYEKDVMW